MVETYLEILELGYFELGEAFKGLADENVWKRPADGLLSIGELAGHIGYWEALRLAGEGIVQSPLLDTRFAYYPTTICTSPSEEHRAMTATQVLSELLRVHQESLVHFKALNPELTSQIPGCPTGFTYGEFLKYLGFHIAYHTGQIYTVRHLLGEETPDN